MAKRGKVIQIQKDRINELPVDVLDNIMGFLSIEEAARTAVLSSTWRDTWSNLTQLNFDDHFFDYMKKKYSNDWTSASLHVTNKVLLQHNRSIRKFVFSLQSVPLIIRSRSFDFNQWFLRVTRKGVEELHFSLSDYYRLPNCIFSCPTLKKLYLHELSFEPVHAPSILPNVTSLCFKQVNFKNIIARVADVPLLENLSFTECINIHDFKITAPKLSTLKIHSCCSQWENYPMLPASLDLRSIRTLDLSYSSLEDFVEEVTNMRVHPPALNVECLKLSDDCPGDDMSSEFIDLLQMCPKLCEFDIHLRFVGALCSSLLYEELHRVTQTHKMLQTLKLSLFTGSRSEMHFIKLLLACFPALEKVIIICHKKFSSTKEFDIMKKLLRFPRASRKAEIIYD